MQSDAIKKGISRAPARAMLKATGLTDADLARPLVALAMLALVISASIHMRIGLKEIIEDYVHGQGAKVAALLLVSFFAIGVGLACTLALVKISLGS